MFKASIGFGVLAGRGAVWVGFGRRKGRCEQNWMLSVVRGRGSDGKLKLLAWTGEVSRRESEAVRIQVQYGYRRFRV